MLKLGYALSRVWALSHQWCLGKGSLSHWGLYSQSMLYSCSLKNSQNNQHMSKRSVRNKAKIISLLFKTREHLYSEQPKVTFVCVSQERERTDEDMMASEMRRNTAELLSQPALEPLVRCSRCVDLHGSPALKGLLSGGGKKWLRKWAVVQAVIDAESGKVWGRN